MASVGSSPTTVTFGARYGGIGRRADVTVCLENDLLFLVIHT